MARIHERLQQDCLVVWRFPLCHLLLLQDANYPWFILVPDRENITEIYQLDDADQLQLARESAMLATVLAEQFDVRHFRCSYRSPLGVLGAVVALLIALATLVALFVTDPIYQKVVVGAAVWYGLGLLWFAFYARHRLVLSPEESFALSAHSSRDDA